MGKDGRKDVGKLSERTKGERTRDEREEGEKKEGEKQQTGGRRARRTEPGGRREERGGREAECH